MIEEDLMKETQKHKGFSLMDCMNKTINKPIKPISESEYTSLVSSCDARIITNKSKKLLQIPLNINTDVPNTEVGWYELEFDETKRELMDREILPMKNNDKLNRYINEKEYTSFKTKFKEYLTSIYEDNNYRKKLKMYRYSKRCPCSCWFCYIFFLLWISLFIENRFISDMVTDSSRYYDDLDDSVNANGYNDGVSSKLYLQKMELKHMFIGMSIWVITVLILCLVIHGCVQKRKRKIILNMLMEVQTKYLDDMNWNKDIKNDMPSCVIYPVIQQRTVIYSFCCIKQYFYEYCVQLYKMKMKTEVRIHSI